MPTRFIVWFTLLALIGYDIAAALTGSLTISEQIRVMDREMGGLIRWAIVALWLHWFLKPFWGNWTN